MTLQTWILILAVFAAVVLTRVGRHRYSRRTRLLTVAVIAFLFIKYVRGMTTVGDDLALETACAVAGVLFGLGMTAASSVERDESGQLWFRAGLGYVVLWVVMLGVRVVFAYAASDFARRQVGQFFIQHHLTGGAVTPAFVLMTIASLLVVMLATEVRGRAGAPQPTEMAARP
jgi:hypothetical protein